MTRGIVLLTAWLLLAACHGHTTPSFDPALYPRSHPFYDLTFFWRTDRSADTVTVAGFARNTRFAYVKNLEVTATLLDGEGKKLSEKTFFFFPNLLPMDDLAPFSLDLPLKPGEQPVKIRFLYRYRPVEGKRDKTTAFNTFEADIP
jgi:hypothetical protein